jgi:hypothetical protein
MPREHVPALTTMPPDQASGRPREHREPGQDRPRLTPAAIARPTRPDPRRRSPSHRESGR